jgi:hypothetical protein
MFAAGGLLYGVLLSAFGFGLSNGGDGAMIPLYVFGSPLFFPLVVFAPVVFWPIIGILLAAIRVRGYRRSFLVLMAVHYIGIAMYLLTLGDWGQTRLTLTRFPGVMTFAFGIYFVGQVVIWGYYSECRKPQSEWADV